MKLKNTKKQWPQKCEKLIHNPKKNFTTLKYTRQQLLPSASFARYQLMLSDNLLNTNGCRVIGSRWWVNLAQEEAEWIPLSNGNARQQVEAK